MIIRSTFNKQHSSFSSLQTQRFGAGDILRRRFNTLGLVSLKSTGFTISHYSCFCIPAVSFGRRKEQMEEESNGGKVEKKMEGVASIALLPSGSISGHFIHLPHSICYGLHGTELACERECSRGEDYRLIKLTIMDYVRKKEQVVVVERRGHDAARLCSVDHAHGWEKDIVGMVEQKDGKHKISVSFECETLKADTAAEDHIGQFMPKLAGLDAVVNIGRMSIIGVDFEAEE